MRYKNKYFREVLEKDFQSKDLGVNIHCKDDGIHVTVPPYPMTGDDFTNDYGIVKAIQLVAKEYFLKVELEKALYGDNIKIKLKVYDEE